jgi:hypothetical protein
MDYLIAPARVPADAVVVSFEYIAIARIIVAFSYNRGALSSAPVQLPRRREDSRWRTQRQAENWGIGWTVVLQSQRAL